MGEYHEYLFSDPLRTELSNKTCIKMYFDSKDEELRQIIVYENFEDIYRANELNLIENIKEVTFKNGDLSSDFDCGLASEENQSRFESYVTKFLKVINCS